LSRLPNPPKDLSNRVLSAVNLYPCDILFIHRDAEGCELNHRVQEIEAKVNELAELQVPVLKVIPVRMTEAWLLFDERAIRTAASNPNRNVALELPNFNHIENIADPKSVLHEALRQASQLSGRRIKKFKPHNCVYRISELIDDFSPLRTLPAFCALETELQSFLEKQAFDEK